MNANTNTAKTIINLPYAVWSTIYDVQAVIEVLRVEPLLACAPSFNNPRRMEFRNRPAPDGCDEVMEVSYWLPGGNYATALVAGYDDSSYGTQWSLVELKLRFPVYEPSVGREDIGKRISIRLTADEIRMFDLARRDVADTRAQAQKIAHRLAEPVKAINLNRAVRRATEEAGESGIAFSWLPGQRPYQSSGKRWTWGRFANWDPEYGYVNHNDPEAPTPVEDMSW